MPSCSISRPRRIAEAIRRRSQLAALPDLTAYRLFHGEAEGAPGLAVDRFGDVAVIHVDARQVYDVWRDALAAELASAGSVYVKVHAKAAPRPTPTAPPKFMLAEPAWGSPVAEVEVTEHAAHYLVRPPAGLSVGLFVDMRDVRGWVQRNSTGRSVLNLFAYTCAFGVSASIGAARRVVNIDVSQPYLAWGRDNYRVNALDADPRDFIFGDAFDWLERFRRRSTRFDLVIVDPPSFSSTPFSVMRDYPRLVDAAARVVERAGILVAATNNAGTSETRFESWLWAGLESAGRHAEVVQRWHEPETDFPLPLGRTPFLKVRALVLD